MQRRASALTAAALALLPLRQSLLLSTLGIATATTAVVLHQGAAAAQDASDVARIAKAITVRIEGATQGSGVIVKREGSSYTVLTAWHVVRSSRPGEEIGIYTSDGQQQRLDQGSIERLGQVDMAVLTFSNPGTYQVASVGDMKSVSSGNPIFVSGFPLPTSSVPTSIWRFLDGKVIANATVAIPDGYQLLYSNPTLPGMSGGSVLNTQGQLVGIHGRSERDDLVSMRTGKAVSTGTNQAVPISYYSQFDIGKRVVASTTKAKSADDYLALANQLQGKKGKERELLHLANQSLAIQPTALGYFYRGYAKDDLKDYQGAINDYSNAITINPQNAIFYSNRGRIKHFLKDHKGEIDDYNKAIAINPQFATPYNNRGDAKIDLGDYQGAIDDFNKAIAINPQYGLAYSNRALAKARLRNYQGAIVDGNKAIAINPQDYKSYVNRGNAKRDSGEYQNAITDYDKAISINPRYAIAYINRCSVLGRLTDYRGAIDNCSKGIAINPQHGVAYGNRGMAKEMIGDREGACSDWRKASSLGYKSADRWVVEDCQ